MARKIALVTEQNNLDAQLVQEARAALMLSLPG